MKRGTRTWYRDGLIRINDSIDWVTKHKRFIQLNKPNSFQREGAPTQTAHDLAVSLVANTNPFATSVGHMAAPGGKWKALLAFPDTTESCPTWKAFNQRSTTSHSFPFSIPGLPDEREALHYFHFCAAARSFRWDGCRCLGPLRLPPLPGHPVHAACDNRRQPNLSRICDGGNDRRRGRVTESFPSHFVCIWRRGGGGESPYLRAGPGG